MRRLVGVHSPMWKVGKNRDTTCTPTGACTLNCHLLAPTLNLLLLIICY